MIHDYSISSGLDYVELNWTHPKFLPERYQLKYVCTMKPTSESKHVKSDYIRKRTTKLSSYTTIYKIADLHPSTICNLILLAVYNPASIDKGIFMTQTTLEHHTSKISSCLGDFIITLGYYLFLQFYIHVSA